MKTADTEALIKTMIAFLRYDDNYIYEIHNRVWQHGNYSFC